jgi:hypothetical protein
MIDDEADIAGVETEVTRRLKDQARHLKRLSRQAQHSSDLGFVWRVQEATEICRRGVLGETAPVGIDPGVSDPQTPWN